MVAQRVEQADRVTAQALESRSPSAFARRAPTKAMVDVRVYDPKGKRVFRKTYDARSFKAGVVRAFKPSFYVSSARRLGKYHVTIRIYTVGGKKLLSKKADATTFRVKR